MYFYRSVFRMMANCATLRSERRVKSGNGAHFGIKLNSCFPYTNPYAVHFFPLALASLEHCCSIESQFFLASKILALSNWQSWNTNKNRVWYFSFAFFFAPQPTEAKKKKKSKKVFLFWVHERRGLAVVVGSNTGKTKSFLNWFSFFISHQNISRWRKKNAINWFEDGLKRNHRAPTHVALSPTLLSALLVTRISSWDLLWQRKR